MPYKSDKQRQWMHSNKPEMAKKWDREHPKRGMRASTNHQKQMAKAIREQS